MTAELRSAVSGGARIEYLLRGEAAPGLDPVVVVPGFGEGAGEYRWLLEAVAPRAAVAVSVRGRGGSDAPPSGYAFEDHVGDVAAAVDGAGFGRFALVAFSRGASYALGLALQRPGAVATLVIGDYQARHVGLPASFVDHTLATVWRGVPMADRMPRHAIEGVQRESVEIPLWERLADLSCPLLVLTGDRRSVLVDAAAAARYRAARPDVEIDVIPGAGHDLWGRDPGACASRIVAFIDRGVRP